MNFTDQLSNISNDTHIQQYFQNKNLHKFILDYIKIDHLIQQTQETNNIVLNKLNSLQSSDDNIVNELLNLLKLQIQLPQQSQQSRFIHELNESLNNHPILTSIDQNVYQLQKNFTSSSSKKGQVTENILFNNLINLFPDTEVINTSHTPNSGDIQLKKDNYPTILIDSKNFTNNVPRIDLDKFYNDLKINNCSGILCNSNAGIANREHFQIDIQDNNIYVFISNHQYDNTLFKLAVKIIYNIYDIIKDNKVGIIELDKELFNRLKIEYNFFLSTFQQHIHNLKSNIMSLEKLTFVQLDHFFKRTNLNTDLKPFSCQLCGTGCSSDKTLKNHLKTKHDIILAPKTKKDKTKHNEITQESPPQESQSNILTYD